MNFVKASNALIARVTLSEIADANGVSENLIQRARMNGDGGRTPPVGWQISIAMLARKRAAELVKLAEQLEKEVAKDE